MEDIHKATSLVYLSCRLYSRLPPCDMMSEGIHTDQETYLPLNDHQSSVLCVNTSQTDSAHSHASSCCLWCGQLLLVQESRPDEGIPPMPGTVHRGSKVGSTLLILMHAETRRHTMYTCTLIKSAVIAVRGQNSFQSSGTVLTQKGGQTKVSQ